jgi:hypothetical protein
MLEGSLDECRLVNCRNPLVHFSPPCIMLHDNFPPTVLNSLEL